MLPLHLRGFPLLGHAQGMEKRLHSGGHEIVINDEGSGPTLLFVHGYLVSSRDWAMVCSQLAPRFRCISVDLLGHGESAVPTSGFDFSREAHARTLTDVLDQLQVASCTVVGHSMGGGIALTWTHLFAERAERQILVNSHCYPFTLPLSGRLVLLPKMGEVLFRKFYGRRVFMQHFRDQVFNGDRSLMVQEDLDYYFSRFARPHARRGAYAAFQHLAEPTTLGPRIPHIGVDTLVVWGEEDRIFPLALGERLAAELPRGRLERIQRCGHAPLQQRPEKLSRLITDFALR